jgi:hypothetical protein
LVNGIDLQRRGGRQSGEDNESKQDREMPTHCCKHRVHLTIGKVLQRQNVPVVSADHSYRATAGRLSYCFDFIALGT